MLVVAAGDDAVDGVAEGDGENSCGFGAVERLEWGDFPGLPRSGEWKTRAALPPVANQMLGWGLKRLFLVALHAALKKRRSSRIQE